MRRDIVAGGLLLERDEQLGQVQAAIDGVQYGSGSVLVISGPAGVGKTSLLRAAVEQARRRKMEVLSARGEELERDLGHGVTRQLLDRVVAGLDDDERAALLDGAAALSAPVLGLATAALSRSIDPEFAARHGLTWLLAGLAQRRPIMLALDDAQWADPPALRWLAYLAQRLDQLGVLIVLTLRSGEPSSDIAALDAICRDARGLALGPLSPAAVAELVRARTGLTPDADLITSCLAATGGNPFLLDATLTALEEEGPDALRRPAGVASVGPAILRRLARLAPDATALARAVAVLGDGCELAAAAQLAGMSIERAAVAADALVGSELFAAGAQLGFAHGLVRDAVAVDVGQHAMRAAHAQAARVLRELGAPAQRIAPHLLHAPRQRDPAATADLRHAARVSLAQGAATTAVTLLRRALAEPPSAGERGDVLLELGMAELVSGDPDAPERLSAAIEALHDPRAQAAAAQARTTALIGQARLHDAFATIERVRRSVTAHERELVMLDALQLIIVMTAISLDAKRGPAVARLRAAVASAVPDAPETRGAAALLAGIDAIAGAPAAGVAAAVAREWNGGSLLDALGPEHIFCLYAAISLVLARQLDATEALTTQIAERASADGSVTGAWHAWMLRAAAREGMGRLADAEADIELTLNMSAPAALENAQHIVHALQARICIERSDLAGARLHLSRVDADSDNFLARVGHLTATARLARAEGARTVEREAFRRLEELAGEGEYGTWMLGCWPAELAVSLGPCDEARDWAAHALRGARARDVRAEIGIALRAQALVESKGIDIELLRTAVRVLEGSDMALEHARTLVELGAALRRRGNRRDARQPLATGLDRATRCGATALAQRAHTELRATGARPRRLLVSGSDALTPSERRIATLAAEGRSNSDIAQSLFVTTRTVETHLSHVYRKLDITRRTELSTALAAT